MNLLGNKPLFAIALFAGVAIALAEPVYQRVTEPAPATLNKLIDGIYVSEQVTPAQIAALRRKGIAKIIDLRPDGEVAGQPGAEQMRAAANAQRIMFDYVPVSHGPIPGASVAALEKVLAEDYGPVLLYCRSGRRAARTWGLVEASRPGGQGADAIIAAVKASGQSADDLRDEIVRRVAARPANRGAKT